MKKEGRMGRDRQKGNHSVSKRGKRGCRNRKKTEESMNKKDYIVQSLKLTRPENNILT